MNHDLIRELSYLVNKKGTSRKTLVKTLLLCLGEILSLEESLGQFRNEIESLYEDYKTTRDQLTEYTEQVTLIRQATKHRFDLMNEIFNELLPYSKIKHDDHKITIDVLDRLRKHIEIGCEEYSHEMEIQ